MGRYLDLARRVSVAAEGYAPNEINEIRSLGLPDDHYSKRLQAALRQVCRPDYPAGMILWLGKSYPALYNELTVRLPDEIHRLWAAHAPLEEFDRVLDVWLEVHRTACELYQAAPARLENTTGSVRRE